MGFFKRNYSKIRYRLTAAFVVISFLMGINSLISLNTYKRISKSYDKVDTQTLPQIKYLDEMQYQCVRLISSTTELAYIMSINPELSTEEAEDQEENEVGQTCTSCHIAYSNYIKLGTATLSENTDLINQIKSNGRQLHVLSKDFVKANNSHLDQDSIFEIKEAFEDLEGDFLANIEQAKLEMKEQFMIDQALVRNNIKDSSRRTRFISITALVLSLILGISIAHSISKPIIKLTRITNRYTKGDLNAKVDRFSKGEIGVLQRSFNAMAGRVRELIIQLEDEVNRTQQAEELYRLSSKKMELLLEAAGEGIIGLDAKGLHAFVNPMACNLLGFTKEELIGKYHHAQYHHTDRDGSAYPKEKCPVYATLTKGTAQKNANEILWRKDNSSFPAEISSYPIIVNGQIQGAVIVFNDITERVANERKLIEDKNKAEQSNVLKSAFLANMSHEIRTPMNGILGFASVLKYGDPSKEERDQYVSIIEESGNRMLNIINDIIDLSKIESGLMEVKLEESNINEQLNYIISFFASEANNKGVDLVLANELFSKNVMILTDREKLFAVLTNLVKNALKFTQEGTVEISCRVLSKRTDDVPDELQFCVKDTGVGIPENKHDAIFDRFIQANKTHKLSVQGTGLGLSISKAYVELLGGKIWLESKVGVGSSFFFTLNNKA